MEFMFWFAAFLWLIEVFLLYLMNLSLLGEVTFFRLLFEDTKVSIAFLVSLILFFFFLIFGGLLGIYLIIAMFLGWPFFMYSLQQEEKELKSKRLRKNKEEIEWLERNLSDIGDDFGPLLRLGRLYVEIGDEEKALIIQEV